jgi:hypothetical protein
MHWKNFFASCATALQSLGSTLPLQISVLHNIGKVEDMLYSFVMWQVKTSLKYKFKRKKKNHGAIQFFNCMLPAMVPVQCRFDQTWVGFEAQKQSTYKTHSII